MPLTRYTCKTFLDHVWFGGSARHYRMPATKQLYVGLLAPTGGKLIEIAGKLGYSRQPLKFVPGAAEDRFINDAEILFVAGELWPAVSDFGIYDAETGGHLLAYAPMKRGGCVLAEGDKLVAAPGDVVIGS